MKAFDAEHPQGYKCAIDRLERVCLDYMEDRADTARYGMCHFVHIPKYLFADSVLDICATYPEGASIWKPPLPLTRSLFQRLIWPALSY